MKKENSINYSIHISNKILDNYCDNNLSSIYFDSFDGTWIRLTEYIQTILQIIDYQRWNRLYFDEKNMLKLLINYQNASKSIICFGQNIFYEKKLIYLGTFFFALECFIMNFFRFLNPEANNNLSLEEKPILILDKLRWYGKFES